MASFHHPFSSQVLRRLDLNPVSHHQAHAARIQTTAEGKWQVLWNKLSGHQKRLLFSSRESSFLLKEGRGGEDEGMHAQR
jgi:hypothetical protein